MKRLALKFIILLFFFVGLYFMALKTLSKGYVDGYYYKFLGKSDNLIIGLSRAHDGIVPKTLDSVLLINEDSTNRFLNFAFEKTQSPYGLEYFDAIRRKIGESDNNGIFILSVTPGSFLAPKDIEREQIIELDKEQMILGKAKDVSSIPNYSYLMHCYGSSLYNIFHTDQNRITNRIVHKDGWNEFRLKSPDYVVTNSDLDLWKSQTLEGYRDIVQREQLHDYRRESFVKLIAFLKGKGKLVVVRMPVAKEIFELENTHWPNFSSEILDLTKEHGVLFLDYSNIFHLKTYDGSHLVSESALDFSKMLASDIKTHLFD